MPTQNRFDSNGAAEFSRFRSKNEKRGRALKIIIWLVVILLLLAAAAAACKVFFTLDTIVVDTVVAEGTGHYSFTEITDTCGVKKGQLIFSLSQSKISSSLTQRFPFIRSVKVEKQYPSTVVITVEEEQPEFYFELSGEYYLITRSLKILDYFAYEEQLLSRYPDVMKISIPTVSHAMVGGQVGFASDAQGRHTDEVLTTLAASRLFEGITKIDLSDRFDITLSYQDRIELHMGSATNFSEKLDLSLGMISAYSEEATGKIYVENVQQGIAQIKDPAAE